MKAKHILAFDMESNGLPQTLGDSPVRAIELACLLIDIKTKNVVSKFHHFIKLEEEDVLDEEAVAIHGITREWLEENGHSRSDVFAALWYWLEDNHIKIPSTMKEAEQFRGQVIALGQNLERFDMIILDAWANEEGYPYFTSFFTYHTIDPMPVAKAINEAAIQTFGYGGHPFEDPENGFPSVTLVNQARGIGIPEEEIKEAHGALWDIETTWKCWLHHIRRIGLGLKATDDQEGQLLPAGTSCPHCGAYAEEKEPHLYWCMICGKTHHIEER